MVNVVARKMLERGCTHCYSPGCRSAHGLSFVSNHAGARAYGNGMIGILPSCDAWILNPSLRLRGLMGSNTWRPHQIEENGDHLLPSFYLFATLLRTNLGCQSLQIDGVSMAASVAVTGNTENWRRIKSTSLCEITNGRPTELLFGSMWHKKNPT